MVEAFIATFMICNTYGDCAVVTREKTFETRTACETDISRMADEIVKDFPNRMRGEVESMVGGCLTQDELNKALKALNEGFVI